MKKRHILLSAAALLLADLPVAFAGFFGTFNPVPEPSSMALLAIGGAAAIGMIRKRNKDD